MYQEYDGCSDFFYESGTDLLSVYPSSPESLAEIRKYIAKHNLTKEDVKSLKSENCYKLVAIADLTLTLLHEEDQENER